MTATLERPSSPHPLDADPHRGSVFAGIRRGAAGVGLLGIAALGALGSRAIGNPIGTVVVVVLTVAAVAALFEGHTAATSSAGVAGMASRHASAAAYWVVAAVSAGAVQSWFGSSGALAGGDISPPAGTAWIMRLFDAWQWGGSNLGGPTAPLKAPWAAVFVVVHDLGGSAALAQRIWYTLLFAGAALAALTLLRLLALGPLGAAAGALVYVFNPFVLSVVGTNAVYLAALALAAALPACLVAAGTGRLRMRWAVVLCALSAPLLGYVYENPPLLAVVAAASCFAVALAWVRFGATTGRRSVLALGLGAPAASLASAYWAVPAAIALKTVAGGQLSAPSSWTWTEGRATIPNALWLNTTWGWAHPEYFGYAERYGHLPLMAAKYVLPFVAFGALCARLPGGSRESRLLGLTVLGALAIVFVSTGTRSPGSVVFEPLYRLPYGWLLREPGRFLMGVGLLYAVLVGIATDRFVGAYRRTRTSRAWLRLLLPIGAAGAAVAVLGAAYPLVTGALVPGRHDGFPSTHVRLPHYWTQMADFLNRGAPGGRVLVLPEDDFYQMPYSWYYGADGFITDLVQRPVLDPVGEGYSTVSPTMTATVGLASESLLRHDFAGLRRAVGALGTPLLLVRGDVRADFPGRSIVPPARLAASLARDPNARLVHTAGPLTLWSIDVSATAAARSYATVNAKQPDLRILAVLPGGTHLVTGLPTRGHLSVEQPPPLGSWSPAGGKLTATLSAPKGWRYSIARLGAVGASDEMRLNTGKAYVGNGLTAAMVRRAGSQRLVLSQRLGRSLLADGEFKGGPWAHVGDCNDVVGPAAARGLSVGVGHEQGPGGTPALRLSANVDSACEAKRLSWAGGPLYLDLWARHVAGAPPRICLWESGRDRCATAQLLSPTRTWSRYRAVVTPDPGTTKLALFLYADSMLPGQHTVNEYAKVSVHSLSAAGLPVVLGVPTRPRTEPVLNLSSEGYSQQWTAPGRHVLVDGMRNGWLTDRPIQRLRPRYTPAAIVRAADWTSLGVVLLALAAVAVESAKRLRRGMAGSRAPGRGQ